MDQGGGDVVLTGANHRAAVGGQSVYRDGQTDRLVCHYYDARDGGKSKLLLAELRWTNDGWLTAARASGDGVDGFNQSEDLLTLVPGL